MEGFNSWRGIHHIISRASYPELLAPYPVLFPLNTLKIKTHGKMRPYTEQGMLQASPHFILTTPSPDKPHYSHFTDGKTKAQNGSSHFPNDIQPSRDRAKTASQQSISKTFPYEPLAASQKFLWHWLEIHTAPQRLSPMTGPSQADRNPLISKSRGSGHHSQ